MNTRSKKWPVAMAIVASLFAGSSAVYAQGDTRITTGTVPSPEPAPPEGMKKITPAGAITGAPSALPQAGKTPNENLSSSPSLREKPRL